MNSSLLQKFCGPAFCTVLTLIGFVPVFAQTATVYASGLENPSRIIAGPNGYLLVTEATATPDTGRVSLLDTGGNRRTLLDGLPSGPAAPDNSIDGPNGLALNGRTLYIADGEGDSHVNGPSQGTIVPNPAGPSSPMFATVLQVNFSNDVDLLTAGFSLQPADHFTLMDGVPVTLTNSAGDTAVVTALAIFRVDRPDPVTIYRNTHLYGLTLLPSQSNTLYVDDAGNNAVWQVDLTSGRPQLLTRFASIPDSAAPKGPPTSEAVPTSVHAYDDQLLVTLLTGAPFVPGASRVMSIDPASGTASLFMALLDSSIDLVYRHTATGNQQWLVLEYSIGTLATATPAPGRLVLYNTPIGQTLLDGLVAPTGMALNESTNDLYILSRTNGTVVTVNIGS